MGQNSTKQSSASGTDPAQGTEGPRTLIGRISRHTFARMEAETARFNADYFPKLEREANKDVCTDAALLKDIALHYFNQTAREVLGVSKSLDEFQAALIDEIPRFVLYILESIPFLAGPMQEEISQGFTFYCLRVNPWIQVPDEERETVWHVGAITGQALAHAALHWRAKAWELVAEGKLPEQTAQGQETARSPTQADRLRLVLKCRDLGIPDQHIWEEAKYRDKTIFYAWLRDDTSKATLGTDRKIRNAIATLLKEPKRK